MTAIPQDTPAPSSSRAMRIAGWMLTGLFTAFMLMDVGMKLARMPHVEATGQALRLSAGSGFPIGVMGAALLALSLIPRTGVLGAVLLTGLFGGTAAVHLVAGNPLASHIPFGVYLGVIAWGVLLAAGPRRARPFADPPLRFLQ